MKRVISALVFLIGLAAPAWAGFDEGVAAYERGDYETALREFRPLAEQGSAAAQNNLGLMYDNGEGVPQDYAEAAKWYRKAAKQGEAIAQANLGFMYFRGEGMPRDLTQAYMWYDLASSRFPPGAAHDRAVRKRDFVAKHMTPAQIAEAQRLAREWKPKKEGK